MADDLTEQTLLDAIAQAQGPLSFRPRVAIIPDQAHRQRLAQQKAANPPQKDDSED